MNAPLRPVRCTCCDITWSSHPDFLNHLAVRERIAQEIEARDSYPFQRACEDDYRAGLRDAARIARGGAA